VLKQGDMAAVEAAVAALAWQQLATLDSSLLGDLALLVADAHAAGDAEAVQLYGKLLRHYAQVCAVCSFGLSDADTQPLHAAFANTHIMSGMSVQVCTCVCGCCCLCRLVRLLTCLL
jgi:hypothetical protein